MVTHSYSFEQLPEWTAFIERYTLNPVQIKQFACYLKMLGTYNELFNLTAIDKPADVIAFHFEDSLAITRTLDFSPLTMIADVGSGGGFPGIPLKILYPEISLILIEVTRKKVEFLNKVINTLNLSNALTWEVDWRTFLRKTNEPIDLFVSRASLHTDELMRMFKPNCPYQNAQLVYWASKQWKPTLTEQPFLCRQESYTIKNKERRLIFFQKVCS